MKHDRLLYLLQTGNVLLESEVVDFSNALQAYGYEPIDQAPRVCGAGNAFVLGEPKTLFDCDLCAIECDDAE